MANKLTKAIRDYLEKRLFGYGASDDWSYVDQFQGPAKDIKLLGMYSGVAYRCINTISEAMGGQYQPFLYTLDTAGKKKTIPTHPLLSLLNKPNPDMSFYQLIEGSQSFMEQFGEFFWYMVPGALSGYASGVKEIYLLRPDKVGIQLDKKTGDVIGYNYSTGTAGSKIPFTPEEIVQQMTFNPMNPYRGYSTLEAAVEYVKTEEEVSRFTRSYFQNNAAMSGVLSIDGKITRENWNKFVRQFRERYEGPKNAGKVAMVRDSQISFTPIGSNISDMQLNDLKQTTVDQILMMFRIPKGLFGMESDQGLGRASVETLEYIFAKWTMDNKMCRFDDMLQDILIKYYPSDAAAGILVGHQNIIPDDKEFKLTSYNLGVDRWITRGEIRAQDPVLANTKIAGDEQLFTNIQQVPLTDPDAEPVEPVMPAKPDNQNDPDKDDDNDSNSKDDTDDDSSKSIKIIAKKKVKSLTYSIAQKEAYRLGLEKNSIAYARKYKQALEPVLKKQEKTVLSNITHLSGKGLADTLLNLGDEDNNIDQAITPVLTALVLEQGQIAMEFSGATDQKYALTQAIITALKQSTKRMSQNFNQETLDQLSASLAEGLQNGETIDQLSTRVSDVYSSVTGYRADRVARTEAQNASNQATLDAYRQNPIVTAMTWFANPGACPFCEDLDGTTVGLEQTFVNQGDSVDITNEDGSSDSYQADYSDIETPPLHPNCSCTIIPVTE